MGDSSRGTLCDPVPESGLRTRGCREVARVRQDFGEGPVEVMYTSHSPSSILPCI
jgi:hypothetical protein